MKVARKGCEIFVEVQVKTRQRVNLIVRRRMEKLIFKTFKLKSLKKRDGGISGSNKLNNFIHYKQG